MIFTGKELYIAKQIGELRKLIVGKCACYVNKRIFGCEDALSIRLKP
jgi:hypothetical protein